MSLNFDLSTRSYKAADDQSNPKVVWNTEIKMFYSYLTFTFSN